MNTDKIYDLKEIDGIVGIRIHEFYEILLSIDKVNWVCTGNSEARFDNSTMYKYYKFRRKYKEDLDNIKLED